ncbi:hypothetical protein [Martelella mangrovi]|uniref:Apea-like HEPN domain-containing protein n=1 Tax=Martelella mangrovi TaxID=1397477 RepID=A0ABV2IE21_9HYPH
MKQFLLATDADGQDLYLTYFDRRFEEVFHCVRNSPSLAIFDESYFHRIAYGGLHLNHKTLVSWLILRSLETTPEQTVEELYSYINDDHVDAYQVIIVEGLYCESSDDDASFSDKLQLSHRWHSPVRALSQFSMQDRRYLAESDDYILWRKISLQKHIQEAGDSIDWKNIEKPPTIEDIEDRIGLLAVVANRGFQIAATAIIPADYVPSGNFGVSYAPHSRRTPVPLGPPVIGIQTQGAEHLFQKFSALPSTLQNRLRIPLRKYNDCLSETDLVEQAIALRVCLESLYLNDGNKNELRYRLALRSSFHIGLDPDERNHIFQSVMACYDQASKAVHTGTISKKNDKPDVMTTTLKTISKSIKKIICDGRMPDYDRLVLYGYPATDTSLENDGNSEQP